MTDSRQSNKETDKSVSQYYALRTASLKSDIARHRRRNRIFIAGEIVLFTLFIAFIAVYAMTTFGTMAIILSLVSLVAYVAVRRMDERNEAYTEWLENKNEVYRRETAYLDGDFTAFDDGKKYIDTKHPFTTDIDIFGPMSLYQRICRTVTSGGADRLAAILSTEPIESSNIATDIKETFDAELPPIERINQRADAIEALARQADWRTEFCAVGIGESIDTDAVAGAMYAVRDIKTGKWVLSPITTTVATLMIAGFAVTTLLAIFTDTPSNIAITWALAQLGTALGLCHSKLMKASHAIGKLQKQMKGYARLINIICRLHNVITAKDTNENSKELKLLQHIVTALDGAKEAFGELEHILCGLDRRGNILGLIISDIFTLSDWRLLRRFAMWQNRHALYIDRWIAAGSEIDALVSMATFRYNEPHAVRAQMTEGEKVVFEAKGLYHPFLGKGAVRNDFSIADRNYYIITGANMAGKSTFLRSLGINWLLAMSGMPVFADKLCISVFPLFTSMRTTDDLTHGISYFNAELLRLESLIVFCSHHNNTLIILDEILKGTNSADKLAGSRLFLEYMSCRSVTGIIATHDLELSRLADERPNQFHNYCFEIDLGHDITYTYKITPNVARNQNATFLLKRLLK